MNFRPALLVLAALATATTSRAQNLFADGFENGTANWTLDTPWHVVNASSPCMTAVLPFPEGTNAMWFGHESTCNFELGPFNTRALTLATPVLIPSGVPSVLLEFSHRSHSLDYEQFDVRELFLSTDGGSTWVQRGRYFDSGWRRTTIDLTDLAGLSVLVKFTFTCGDNLGNEELGWIVDDIVVRVDTQAGTQVCAGDGIQMNCPCQNNGAPGHGCASSFNPAGALLTGSGIPNLSADSLSLSASGMSSSVVTFFQADHPTHLTGFNHGDGLFCSNQNLRRIRSFQAPGGAATYPRPGDASISAAGMVPLGGVRLYAVRYRNAASFCHPPTFNATNSVAIRWAP